MRSFNPPGFKWLVGDINWLDYGGKWVKKVDDKLYHVISFDNWANMVGAEEAKDVGAKYNVTLDEVSTDVSEVEWKRIASVTGLDEEIDLDPAAKELLFVEACVAYGAYDRLYNGDGNNARKLLAEAARIS